MRPARAPLGGEHSPALGSKGTGRRCTRPGPAPAPARPRTWSGRRRRRHGAGRAARAAAAGRAGRPRAGRRSRRCPSPRRRAGILGVVSAGAAHGARPASLRRSPPSGAVLPAAKCKGSAEPARGQAGLDVGALRAGRCSWGARASEEGAGRPNSYKPLREGWPREPISPGRACLFHSHPWLPFLPFALPPLLSP